VSPFRKRTRPCPGCGTRLRQVQLGDREGVDVCDSCGGALLDFFDGEPTALARKLSEHAESFSAKRSFTTPDCPDCEIAMVTAAYLEPDGPSISRCTQCFCVFVTASQVVALGNFQQLEALRDTPDWFDRLVAALRALLR
jgi:Zn-finger nucleic acid-binding protein